MGHSTLDTLSNFSEIAMRTILTFTVLILSLCMGCTNTTTKEKPKVESKVETIDTLDSDKPKDHVEPRFLPDGTPFVPEPDISGIIVEALGKYAAEAVPLPPLEDLTAQIDEYVTKIGKSLDDLDGSPKYAEDAADIIRDANALALIALAVGLADGDSKYKKPAAQIIASAKILAAAKNLDDGQKAFVALQASLTGQGAGNLAWTDKIADLKPAMKALPNLSAGVKRVTDTERKLNTVLGSARAQQVYSQLAAMAVIAQGCVPNVTETTKPEAVADWKAHCEEFRDAAIKTNAAARQYAKDKADGKEDYTVFNTSFKAMTESCDSCHKIFYPSAVGKNE